MKQRLVTLAGIVILVALPATAFAVASFFFVQAQAAVEEQAAEDIGDTSTLDADDTAAPPPAWVGYDSYGEYGVTDIDQVPAMIGVMDAQGDTVGYVATDQLMADPPLPVQPCHEYGCEDPPVESFVEESNEIAVTIPVYEGPNTNSEITGEMGENGFVDSPLLGHGHAHSARGVR